MAKRNLRDPGKLGEALRQAREKADLSLRSPKLPLTPGGLSKVETGESRPSLATLEKLADVYGCAVVIAPGKTMLIAAELIDKWLT